MAWYERLAVQMRERGWSQRELARRSGVPYHSVVKYLTGRTAQPRGDIIAKLAHAVGVSPVWLQHGVDVQSPVSFNGTVAVQRIPVVRLGEVTSVGLTKAISAANAANQTVPVLNHMGSRTFAVLVDDTANTPALQAGDYVYCDPDMQPAPGKFVLATVGSQAMLRRYRLAQIDAKGRAVVELIPENPDFPTISAKATILAVVTHHVRAL